MKINTVHPATWPLYAIDNQQDCKIDNEEQLALLIKLFKATYQPANGWAEASDHEEEVIFSLKQNGWKIKHHITKLNAPALSFKLSWQQLPEAKRILRLTGRTI